MIDSGCYGAFWQSVANCEFEISAFQKEVEKIPRIEHIQSYLKELSDIPVDKENYIYHYLLLQSGAFGSKQIWIENNKWKNNTFRGYWLPTETSSRRSPVNPMMPMPNTLLERVSEIVEGLSGRINAINADVFRCLYIFDELKTNNAVIYIDPPYQNTTGYKDVFDVYELYALIWNNVPFYISEGEKLKTSHKAWCISKGRLKGNISGDRSKKPTEEWLNYFSA